MKMWRVPDGQSEAKWDPVIGEVRVCKPYAGKKAKPKHDHSPASRAAHFIKVNSPRVKIYLLYGKIVSMRRALTNGDPLRDGKTSPFLSLFGRPRQVKDIICTKRLGRSFSGASAAA